MLEKRNKDFRGFLLPFLRLRTRFTDSSLLSNRLLSCNCHVVFIQFQHKRIKKMAFRSCGCVVIFVQRAHGNITSISPYVRESTKVLDSGSQPLDSGSQHLDSGFQPFGFQIPTFWIPDSIPKWILDSKPLWIPDSSVWIPDSNSKSLLDSGFRILLHGAIN